MQHYDISHVPPAGHEALQHLTAALVQALPLANGRIAKAVEKARTLHDALNIALCALEALDSE